MNVLNNGVGIFDSFDGVMLDPVHGIVGYYDHEKEIFSHKQFQRLRFIKQTDVVNFVFMGSNHSRFEHSMGVMHLAGRIFASITQNYLHERDYNESVINPEQLEAIQYIYRTVRVAALLHDVGHFPFAHQFEVFLERNKSKLNLTIHGIWEKIPDKDDVLNRIYGNGAITNQSLLMNHEDLSLYQAYRILSAAKHNSLKNKFDILFLMEKSDHAKKSNFDYLWDNRDKEKNICYYIKHYHSIFLGEEWEQKCEKADKEGESVDKKIVRHTLELLQNIISGELDADKMDYLLRDSYYTGSDYGKYNLEYLLNSLRIGSEKITDPDTGQYVTIRYHLAILDKGLNAFEDFVYSRYQMYNDIYNHKIVCSLRKILIEALDEVFNENMEKEVKEIIEDDTKCTDDYLWERIRENTRTAPEKFPFSVRLVHRKPLKYITTFYDINDDATDYEINRLAKDKNNRGKTYLFWNSFVKFSKIIPGYDSIKVCKREGKGVVHLKTIGECTDFFNKFRPRMIIHIFAKDTAEKK